MLCTARVWVLLLHLLYMTCFYVLLLPLAAAAAAVTTAAASGTQPAEQQCSGEPG
jgi:hypothetical protein